jgi:hypothetical protein
VFNIHYNFEISLRKTFFESNLINSLNKITHQSVEIYQINLKSDNIYISGKSSTFTFNQRRNKLKQVEQVEQVLISLKLTKTEFVFFVFLFLNMSQIKTLEI